MTSPRTSMVVVLLGALQASAQGALTPGPAEDAPSAAGSAATTHTHLLPKGTEVPYLGGETPRGTQVLVRTDAGRSRLGTTLFLVGWIPTLGASAAFVVTSIVLFAEKITMVGLGLLLAAPIVAIPFVGPLLGTLAFSFLTFVPHTLVSVALFALQGAGVAVMLSARKTTVVYLQDAPEYPVRRAVFESFGRPELTPAEGPRLALTF